MTEFPLAFLGMLEALRMGPTFARGRRDERAGHVRSLTVSGSLVVALVRGPDDPAAFRSRIAVRAFGASEWARVETALVAEARFAAGLLDGRMPDGIEAVFAGAGLSLLPLSLDEVAMDCTCERWPMPCAHLAATCYALARAFETDPFEVFTWRGRSRDELLMRLRRLREAAAVDAARSGATARPGAAGGGDPAGSGPAGSGPAGGGDRVGADPDPAAGAFRAGHSGVAGAAGSGPGERRGSVWAEAADPVSFWGSAEPPQAGSGPAGAGKPASRPRSEPRPISRTAVQASAAGEPAVGPGGPAAGTAGSSVAGEPAAGPSVWDERAAGPSVWDERAAGPGERATGAAGAGDPPPVGAFEGVRADALLDQLDAPGLVHHGRPVTEVLRPAYLALPDGEFVTG
ncbi:hypothetical protein [Actinoplanes sp. NPDC049802]|uniref:SWIM zinc finger family protein n=1 Tax=Actinoplanes sp. NPDC049802 TaxID=3154742 RepID=UPI003411E103